MTWMDVVLFPRFYQLAARAPGANAHQHITLGSV